MGLFRDSVRSSTSSDWDCYSELASPGVLDSVAPNQRVWRQHFFARSIDTLDTSSELSYEYPSPFGSSREGLNGTSQESLSLKDSSGDVAGKMVSECSSGAEQSNGACGVDSGDSASTSAKATFNIRCDGDTSDSETPTLRRTKEDRQSELYPGGRKRSNSTLLNDMRMKLIADAVNTEARVASKDFEEGSFCEREDGESGDDSSCVSDAEVTVVVGGDADSCRLYKGVRINDSDEVTRL